MAASLARTGHPVTVYNRTTAKAEAWVAEHGGRVAATPREAAEGASAVITMVVDGAQVEEVVLGEDGAVHGAAPGTLFVDCSTIAPADVRRIGAALAERGLPFVDAPVSGSSPKAETGTLTIMAGGSEEDFARAKPLFDALGKTVVHVGPVGAGQVVKACNQVVVALTIEAVSEALVLGSKAGVDPATIIEVLSGGMAANRVMEVRGRNFLEHDFTPGFRVDLHHKDLGIALQTARQYGVALPNTAAVEQMLQALRTAGRGESDHSALLTLVEDLARHTIGTPAGAPA
jgi:2-hydroxy-3-oxopropionate reductase